MSDQDFQLGESLVWENRENQTTQLTRRSVAFRGWSNPVTAVVAFGLKADGTGQENLFSVPKSELSRPAPHHQVKPETPRQPEPVIPLAQRRHGLSLRYKSYVEAQNLVTEAEELVNRAEIRVATAQRAMRDYADMETHAVDAVVHELRHMNGGVVSHSVADGDEEWTNHAKAKRDCQVAEAALSRLTSELAHAREIADERQQLLQKSAAAVVGSIIEREAEKLVLLEEQVIQLRTQLRAASMLWVAGVPVPVGEQASSVLSSFSFDFQDPPSVRVILMEQRQAPFTELYERLVAGEITADLTWETVSLIH